MGNMDCSGEFIAFAVETGVLRFGEFKTKAGRLSPYFFNAGLFNDGASLNRLTATTFSHTVTDLRNGPFLDSNTVETITVGASGAAVGASVTLTATGGNVFAASDVGALFRLEAKDYSSVKAWEAGMKDVSVGEQVRSDGKVYEAETGGKTGGDQHADPRQYKK